MNGPLCGSVASTGAPSCDREPDHDGACRGYLEAHDEVVFWTKPVRLAEKGDLVRRIRAEQARQEFAALDVDLAADPDAPVRKRNHEFAAAVLGSLLDA